MMKRDFYLKQLINIVDSFKKIIIVKDDIKRTIDDSGIIIISLKDFYSMKLS